MESYGKKLSHNGEKNYSVEARTHDENIAINRQVF